MPKGLQRNLDGGYASVDKKTPLTQATVCYWLLHINGFPVKKKGRLGKGLWRYWLACIVANGCYSRRSVTPPPRHAATNQHILSGEGSRELPNTWRIKRWEGRPNVSRTQGSIQDWQLPVWQQEIQLCITVRQSDMRLSALKQSIMFIWLNTSKAILKSSYGLVSNYPNSSQRAVCLCHDPLWWILWSPFLMINNLIPIRSWDIKSKPNYPIITRKHAF